MSVQTGIFHLEGQLACHGEVTHLLHGTEERGPDYMNVQVTGSIGMGFRGFHIAPEDRDDQPLTGCGESVITFDGRLDNREELARRLGLLHVANLSDAALVLSAFEVLGASCFESLAGEYACTIWDQPHRTLFLVRSRCGTRPLFYTVDDSTITWSSELDDLVLKSGINPIVNDAYAIGYLYYQPDIDESPFANVAVVPAGNYVEVRTTTGVQSPRSTWHPEHTTQLHLSSDGEYEEAWRHEVQRAVACRLRTKHPVFCELSGGLDSSTVALFADRILAESGRDSAMLTTVSCTYQKSTSCDETAFISVVEQTRGRRGLHVTECSQQATLGLQDIEFTGVPNTGHCFPGRYGTTEELMRRSGVRVLLTGIGGDHLFWSDHTGSPELADLICQGRLLRAIAESRKWSQAAAVSIRQTLLTWVCGPIAGAKWFLRWQPSDINLRPWTSAKARRWLSTGGRGQGLRIDASLHPPSLRVRVHTMRSLTALISAGYFQEYHRIYFSHPFAHQNLIDFVLSLPMNQLSRPCEDRSLMRRATRGLLPEKVRMRKSKGSIDEMFCRALEREQDMVGPGANLEVCRREYAEPRFLAQAIRDVALGRLDQSYALVRLFSLERWLRSLDKIAGRRLALQQAEVTSNDAAMILPA